MRAAVPCLSLALALGLAACADDVVCPSAGSFALTEPDGFAELVPGATVTIAWTGDGDPGADVELELTATDGGAPIFVPPALFGAGQLTWDGRDRDGLVAPPANYRIGGVVAKIAACAGRPIVPDDLHLVVVQGVRMPREPITWSGSQLTRMFTVATVTRSVLAVRYAVDPDPATDGDELVFLETTVPGELAPVMRSYPFSGTTVAGADIPGGEYDLIALVGTPTAYRAVGPRLTWLPGS